MKVLMLPTIEQFGEGESGLRRVVEAYHRHLPDYGVELVPPDAPTYDLRAIHAGVAPLADVAHNHGLYWTADVETLTDYEWQANVAVINSLREAKQITVPSEWVAETIRRDMRINPHVIGHGIYWDDWQGDTDNHGYVLWNKNRNVDVCNPEAVGELGKVFPNTLFLTTFAPGKGTPNIKTTGQVPYPEMKRMVKGCAVYLSTVKETYGIGTLEAMAAGKPILGWRNGGNVDLVQHGVNGYLAQTDNYEDLAAGLDYCLEHAQVLGDNGRDIAKGYGWGDVCSQIAAVYDEALYTPSGLVGVVIPNHNKSFDELARAIESALNQTLPPDKIVVVDDGSPEIDPFIEARERYGRGATFIDTPNRGVAEARNHGISELDTKYICSLDADDWLEPTFLEMCVQRLEYDRTIGIAYTALKVESSPKASAWPDEYNARKQFDYEARQNQVPTCCVFRRTLWERTGGYRSRYCPDGAGSEDAALWAHMLSIGSTAKLATPEPLFNYSLGGNTSEQGYQEVDWLAWLPWSRDKRYPFACSVPPNYYSHPVRQYDEPIVSVIIPVGPDHEKELWTALDSLEAQTFRHWEAIVVIDGSWSESAWTRFQDAFPYVKVIVNRKSRMGAGYSRNRGAEIAKGKLLLFLDADDFMNPAEPEALVQMVNAYRTTGHGIYSAHIGRASVSGEYASFAKRENRLLAWNEGLGQAYILNHGIAFDCARALKEPGDNPDTFYIWNLISTLIPRTWHFEIDGFDEAMPTWEDWDYWLRMAKAGHCFNRIQKPFFVYNYLSGTRREVGRQMWSDVLKYLKDKHARIEGSMGCGCSGGNKKVAGSEFNMANEDSVLVKYIHPNAGRHQVVFNGHNYGRHAGGGRERFVISRADLALDQSAPPPRRLFEPVVEVAEPVVEIAEAAPPPPPPAPVAPASIPELDLSSLPRNIQEILQSKDLTTVDAIVGNGGYVGLTSITGIGPSTAQSIMKLVTPPKK